jgi:hypothetical protein
MSFKCKIHKSLHGSYDNILNLIPFRTRCLQLLFEFLHKLILGLIDYPDLLYFINFKINFFNNRNLELFILFILTKTIGKLNYSANLLMVAGNNYTFVFIKLCLSLYCFTPDYLIVFYN